MGRCEDILIWLSVDTEGSFYLPRRALEQSFIWTSVFNYWIHVLEGRIEFESMRVSLLVTCSVPFAAAQLNCLQGPGQVTPWRAYLVSSLSEWGLSRAPRTRGVGFCPRKCMLGWCSQLERRVAEVCLALLESSSQVAAEACSCAGMVGKAVKAPHMAAPFLVCGAQTQAAIWSDKDGGLFPLWAVCPVLYRGRHKEADWFRLLLGKTQQSKIKQNNPMKFQLFYIGT